MDENNNITNDNIVSAENGTPSESGSFADSNASAENSFDSSAFAVPEKKKKKSAAPLIAGGLVIACVGLAAAGVKAFKKTDIKSIVRDNYTDFISRESIYSQITDDSIAQVAASGEYTISGAVKVDECSFEEKLKGAELSFSNIMNAEQKKGSLDMMAKYNGVDLVRIMVSCDENKTRLHVPALFSESFVVENDNVLTQLSKSDVLGEYADEMMKKSGDFSIKPFVLVQASKAAYDLKGKVKELGKDALSAAGETLVYEKGEKMIAPNEKEVTSYTVTWPADSVKKTFTDFINNIKGSEEYKNMVSAQIEYMYASKPELEAQMGTKEEAEAEVTKALDEAVESIGNADIQDIKVVCLPVDNGIYFRMDQPIDGVNVKIDGQYDRNTKEFKIDLTMDKDGDKFEFNYNDSIVASDGIITENHNLNAQSDGDAFSLVSAATFDKSSNVLDGNVTFKGNDNEIKGTFNGNVAKSDGQLDITDGKIVITDAGDSIGLSGNYSIKKRDEEPREINSSSEIELSSLNVMQAMQLYNEANDNVGKIAEILK